MATTAEVTGPLSLNVFNSEGQQVGKVEVDAEELGGKISHQLLHDVVLMYLANQRSGTHSTKRRGEVAGSTKKLFRQKGTGNARVGTRRTNKRVGGGTAKGPKPRDYTYHMPRKAIRASLNMALLSKFKDQEAVVVEEINLPEIKTGLMADLLGRLNLSETSCLIGIGAGEVDESKTLYLSARNIPQVELHPTSQFHTYAVLRPKRLLLTKAALQELCPSARWSGNNPE